MEQIHWTWEQFFSFVTHLLGEVSQSIFLTDFLFQTGQFRTMFAKTAWARMLNEIKAHCYASKQMARDVTPKETKGNTENNIKEATGSEKTLCNTQPPSLQRTEKRGQSVCGTQRYQNATDGLQAVSGSTKL